MTFTPIVKAVLALIVPLGLTAQAAAQGYYYQPKQQQAYPPSYYYYYSNGQAYPYPSSYRYAAPTPAPARPAASRKARPATQPQQEEPKQETRTRETASTDGWMSNWDSAWKKACSQGRPLVTLVVHEGCPECDKMEATLQNSAAMATLDSAVKAKLEFSNNGDFISRYGVKYTPTFLVFSPAHKGEVYREVGALSLDRLKTLQPSIEALVTTPQPEEKKPAKTAKSDVSADDESTSRSVASL